MLRTVAETLDHFNMTKHALERMSSRGISTAQVQDALDYGRQIYARGAVIYFLGHQEERRAPAEKRLDRSRGIQVVCSSDGKIITVYRNNSPKNLRTQGRTVGCGGEQKATLFH